jgi:uncharacterized protein YjbJ (UPF0337 family)
MHTKTACSTHTWSAPGCSIRLIETGRSHSPPGAEAIPAVGTGSAFVRISTPIKIMKSGNQDKVEGTAKDVKGRLKESAGALTSDARLKREGRADQVEGRVQKAVSKIKKKLED